MAVMLLLPENFAWQPCWYCWRQK